MYISYYEYDLQCCNVLKNKMDLIEKLDILDFVDSSVHVIPSCVIIHSIKCRIVEYIYSHVHVLLYGVKFNGEIDIVKFIFT